MTWQRALAAAALAVLVLGLGAVIVVAARTARAEAAAFRPRRPSITRPLPLAAADDMEEIAFTSASGTTLAGWWIPSRNGAAVVLAHGSGGSRMDLAVETAALRGAGFGALVFDWPGHGTSEGSVTFGQAELAAFEAAISFAESRPGVSPSRIGALGASIGGALAILGAAEDARVRALVLIGVFTDSDQQTRAEYGHLGLLGQVPVWVDHCFMDGPLRPIDAAPALAGRPVLYVAGELDRVVPPAMTRQLYATSGPLAELWMVAGAGHTDLHETLGDAYGSRIVAFFRRALNVA